MMSLCMGFEQGIKVAVVSERDRRNRNGLLEKLPPEQFDFEAVFRRICGSERTRHRSVKLVHDISGDPTHVDSAFLASLGFRDLRLIEWDWSNEDDAGYGATQKMSKGGFVKTAQMEKERNLSTFVFLRCEGVEPGEHEAIARYSTLIGILMHEMGHVDDIEKGKFLKVGGRVDIVSAEEYAHRYALKWMTKENLRFPMGLLMGSILKDANGSPSVAKEAAKRVVESGEFKSYREFIGTLVDIEACAGMK
jgi:hypothetical protein